jgi:hypothetical protein
MLIGDKNKFAVQITVEGAIDGWILGSYLLWACGTSIGDKSDYSVDLRGCRNWMRDFIEKHRDRYGPGLYEMDKVQAYVRLASAVLPGENPSGFAQEMYDDTFSRFHISHIGMSSFDNVTLLMVKNEKGMERLVWRSGDEEIKDAYLEAGEVERIFGEAMRALIPT